MPLAAATAIRAGVTAAVTVATCPGVTSPAAKAAASAGRSPSRRASRTSPAASRPESRQWPVSQVFIDTMPSTRCTCRASPAATDRVITADSRLMPSWVSGSVSRSCSSDRSAGSKSSGSSSAS
jgi:hypothetical protein